MGRDKGATRGPRNPHDHTVILAANQAIDCQQPSSMLLPRWPVVSRCRALNIYKYLS